MRKYSIAIRGHRTSFSLEEEFHTQIRAIARSKQIPLAKLVTQIDEMRGTQSNLSSAIRLYVLDYLLQSQNHEQ